MGIVHSLPSQVHQEDTTMGIPPPRTKLTKPRTNSITMRGHSHQGRLSILRAGDVQPGLVNPVDGFEPLEGYGAGERNSIVQIDLPPPQFLAPDSYLVLTWGRGDDRPTRGLDGVIGHPQSVPGSFALRTENNLATPARRKSQIRAAPPATATRRVKCQELDANPADYLSQQPPCVCNAELDAGRCETPSGYSVIGAFKRGSLRIVNGAASPAPSSLPGSPTLVAYRGGTGPSPLLSSQTSNLEVPRMVVRSRSLESGSLRGSRLTPSSPIDKTPGSPFSFAESPTNFSPDISKIPVLSLKQDSGPCSSESNVDVDTAVPEQPPAPCRTDGTPSPPPTPHSLHSHPKPPSLQDCDGHSGTDSGYSSGGSLNIPGSPSGRRSDGSPACRESAQPPKNLLPSHQEQSIPHRPKKSIAQSLVAVIKWRRPFRNLRPAFTLTQPPASPVDRRRGVQKVSRATLKHQRSKSGGVRIPTPVLRSQIPLPDIEPVPPLPPIGDRRDVVVVGKGVGSTAASTERRVTTDKRNNLFVDVGAASILRRGSKITGQDYYQRFSVREPVD